MQEGDFVQLYLIDPTEKRWGRLLGLSDAGIMLRGFDVKQIETFKYQFRKAERLVIPQTTFFPMRRVLQVDLDEPLDHIPAIIEEIEQTSGLSKNEIIEFK